MLGFLFNFASRRAVRHIAHCAQTILHYTAADLVSYFPPQRYPIHGGPPWRTLYSTTTDHAAPSSSDQLDPSAMALHGDHVKVADVQQHRQPPAHDSQLGQNHDGMGWMLPSNAAPSNMATVHQLNSHAKQIQKLAVIARDTKDLQLARKAFGACAFGVCAFGVCAFGARC